MQDATNDAASTGVQQASANGNEIAHTTLATSENTEQAASTPTTTANGAPLPNSSDPELIATWDRCWGVVMASPLEFEAWEELMRLADRQDGGFGPEAPAANMANVRIIYDAFLAQFPLCFGYWKKYSDLAFANEGVKGAQAIFERSVVSFPNSVDLWVHYCTLMLSQQTTDDVSTLEKLFERGAECVGQDFMPHEFWDKYLGFYESRGEFSKAFALLKRIICIPMHQYAQYFGRYAQMVSGRYVKELISAEEYDTYRKTICTIVGENGQLEVIEKSDEQIEAEMRNILMDSVSGIYNQTANETNKRWVFEAEVLKRPYFHVKPLDMQQLANWNQYLDFEESEGDEDRIKILYERCLVPAALYEELWLRYVTWLQQQCPRGSEGVEALKEVEQVYVRAEQFVPSYHPSIRLSHAMLAEELGQVDKVRQLYKGILKELPGHTETIVRYANFERRQSPLDLSKCEQVYVSQMEEEIGDRAAQMAVVVLYANFLWRTKKNIEAARAIFKTGEGQFVDSLFYFLNYVKFEMAQQGPSGGLNDIEAGKDDYLERVSAVFEQVRESALPPSAKHDFMNRYLDFLMEFGDSAGMYTRLEMELQDEATPNRRRRANAEASRKRKAEEALGAGTNTTTSTSMSIAESDSKSSSATDVTSNSTENKSTIVASAETGSAAKVPRLDGSDGTGQQGQA